MSDDIVSWEHRETQIAELEAEIERLRAERDELLAALRPFGDYADKRHVMPGSMVITNGSIFAKGQLTMADCYHAATAVTKAESRK
jgi:hypothetical protein